MWVWTTITTVTGEFTFHFSSSLCLTAQIECMCLTFPPLSLWSLSLSFYHSSSLRPRDLQTGLWHSNSAPVKACVLWHFAAIVVPDKDPLSVDSGGRQGHVGPLGCTRKLNLTSPAHSAMTECVCLREGINLGTLNTFCFLTASQSNFSLVAAAWEYVCIYIETSKTRLKLQSSVSSIGVCLRPQ